MSPVVLQGIYYIYNIYILSGGYKVAYKNEFKKLKNKKIVI